MVGESCAKACGSGVEEMSHATFPQSDFSWFQFLSEILDSSHQATQPTCIIRPQTRQTSTLTCCFWCLGIGKQSCRLFAGQRLGHIYGSTGKEALGISFLVDNCSAGNGI